MKVAVVQTGCFGDNVNSTLMFRPIKNKWENGILDVYTSQKYSSAFDNNPHINNLYSFPAATKNQALHLMHTIQPQKYDLVIKSHPMIQKQWSSHLHPELGENLILAWVKTLENHKIDYEFPLQSDLYLTKEEESKTDQFIQSLPKPAKGFILMECEGESGQSFWNWHWTERTTRLLTKKGYTVLVSCIAQKDLIGKLSIETGNKVVWVGGASIRMASRIYDHCEGFISVSSGLSNACNVRQRKPVKHWVEVVNSKACSSNAIRSDAAETKTFWHDNDLEKYVKMMDQKF